jgi:hypothetical protein
MPFHLPADEQEATQHQAGATTNKARHTDIMAECFLRERDRNKIYYDFRKVISEIF